MLNLKSKYFIKADLVFETAFHIGSGKEGDSKVDNGILKDFQGRPILPGSTLKGNFRSLAEKISHSLGLKACFLDINLLDSPDFICVNGISDDNFKKLKNTILKAKDPYDYMIKEGYLCDICKLFGSKMHASRIFFSDGLLKNWSDILYIRDGVCIERDTETAKDGAKYDYEVAPDQTIFEIKIEVENPSDNEKKLIAACLSIWNEGIKIGGNTSRGLGKARLDNLEIKELDFSNKDSFYNFIKNGLKSLNKVELSSLLN